MTRALINRSEIADCCRSRRAAKVHFVSALAARPGPAPAIHHITARESVPVTSRGAPCMPGIMKNSRRIVCNTNAANRGHLVRSYSAKLSKLTAQFYVWRPVKARKIHITWFMNYKAA